jgi:hypothetical protein
MATKSFFNSFFSKIGQIFTAIGSFFSKFFEQETQFFQFFFTLQDTVNRARQQLDDFKQWSVDEDLLTQWKTRVILAPRVIDAAKELKDEIIDTFGPKLQALEDDLKQFLASFKPQPPSTGAEADAGALTNTTLRIQAVLDQLNKAVTLINELLDFTEQIADIKKKILSLDGVFLQQGNPRVRIKGTISARQGKLHASA